MSKWRIAAVLVVAMAILAVGAAPALAAEGTITVPTYATIPGSGGNPSPIVQNVWVFDAAAWSNGAVMTGSPATGGGSGIGVGGGIGGGGCVDIFGVIDPNGNNLSSMQIRGWLNPAYGDTMVMLNDADAALWIDRAYQEGFITQVQKDNLMLQVVNSHAWGIYTLRRCFTYHDPAGPYDAYVKAVAGSAWDEADTGFTYLDVVAMDVDYRPGVQFGLVMPGAVKIVTGDFDWGGALPTAQNLGNVPLKLDFVYSPMTKPGGTPADVINTFDLEFQASSWTDAEKEHWDPLAANQMVSLVKPLPVCNRAKMNFSLHAPNNIQDGNYTGAFTVFFSKAL